MPLLPDGREKRLSKITVVLSDEELAEIHALADGVPLSTFARTTLLRIARCPSILHQLQRSPGDESETHPVPRG